MAYFNTDFLQQKLQKIRDSKLSVSNIDDVIKEEVISELIEVSSIERSFGKFSHEIDNYFTNFPATDKKIEIDTIFSELSTTSIAKYFLYKKESTFDTDLAWQWLDKLTYCIKIHITAAGEYHQFIEKLSLCKNGIKSINLYLKSVFERLPNISLEDINTVLKECLLIILSVVDVAEDVFLTHKKIVPVYHRICNGERMKAKLLLDCSISGINFAEDDEVFVLSKNFETNLWTAENVKVVEGEEKITVLEIPSLFLILESNDPGIIKKCETLKKQLSKTWKSIIFNFDNLILSTTNEAIGTGKLSKNTDINQNMCHSVLDSLINSLTIDGSSSRNINAVLNLRHRLEDHSITGGDGVAKNWTVLNETIQLFNDIKLYFMNFERLLLSNNCREECNIVIGKPKYVSMAYIHTISEKKAKELELVSQSTLKSDGNLKEIGEVTSHPEHNEGSIKTSCIDQYQFKVYFHESTISPKIPTQEIVKPNVFSAEPTDPDDFYKQNEEINLNDVSETSHGHSHKHTSKSHQQRQACSFDMQSSEAISRIDVTDEEWSSVYNPDKEMLTSQFDDYVKSKKSVEFIDFKRFKIVIVVKTDSGDMIDLKEAEVSNIINLNRGIFFDIKNDKWIPLKDAVLLGLVLLRPVNTDCEIERLHVQWVKIGKDQRKVDLKEAISEGCVNPLDNTYSILEENIEMRLVEAVMCGFIRISDSLEEHKMDHDKYLVLHREKGDPDKDELLKYETDKSLNLKMLSKIQSSNCWNEFVEINEVKETFVESIYRNHIELDPFKYGKDSMMKACVKQRVKLDRFTELLENLEETFIGELEESLEQICRGDKIWITVEEMEEVNRKDVFLIDCDEMNILSVENVSEDIRDHLFITCINGKDVGSKIKQLRQLERIGLETDQRVIRRRKDEKPGAFDTTMLEGVMMNLMNLDTLEIRDERNCKTYDLEMSLKKHLINLTTAEYLLKYVEDLNFDKLVKDGRFDVNTNGFGEEVTLMKSIEGGKVDPKLVYLVWPQRKAIVNLSNLMETNILDGELNEVTFENEEKELVTMKLSEAIANEGGIFLTKLDAAKMKEDLPKSLKELNIEKKLNYNEDKVLFGGTDIEGMIIQDALTSGLLCDESIVRFFQWKENGVKEILYCDDQELAELINGINSLNDNMLLCKPHSNQEDSVAFSKLLKDLQGLEEKVNQFLVNAASEVLPSQVKQLTDKLAKLKNDINQINLQSLTDDANELTNVMPRDHNKIQLTEENIQYNVGTTSLIKVKLSEDELIESKEGCIEEKNQALIFGSENTNPNFEIKDKFKNEDPEPNFLESEKLKIFGAINTENGMLLKVEIAEELGIIEQNGCMFRDILNNKVIGMKEAIFQGLVLLESPDGTLEVDRVFVDWVKIGKEQRKVSLREAISEGSINPLDNSYSIVDENIKMRLVEAIMCGLINIIETPKEYFMDFERFLAVQKSQNDPTTKDLCLYESTNAVNIKLLRLVQLSDAWNEFFGNKDEIDSFAKSIYNNHIEVDPLRAGFDSKESIFAASLRGLILSDKVVRLLENVKESFVGEVIENLEAISLGKVLSKKAGEMKNVDLNDIFIMNNDNLDILSVNKLDEEMDETLFNTKINVKDIADKMKQLSILEETGLDTNTKVIRRPECSLEGFDSTMLVAVMNDSMLLDSLEILDRHSRQRFGLSMSVKNGLIDREAMEYLLKYSEMLNFDKLVKDGHFDVTNNSFGDEISLMKSIEGGKVDPKLVYLMWPERQAFMNLSNLMETNILDGERNEVTFENEGKELVTMKLSEAIDPERGIFVSKIDANEMKIVLEKYIDEEMNPVEKFQLESEDSAVNMSEFNREGLNNLKANLEDFDILSGESVLKEAPEEQRDNEILTVILREDQKEPFEDSLISNLENFNDLNSEILSKEDLEEELKKLNEIPAQSSPYIDTSDGSFDSTTKDVNEDSPDILRHREGRENFNDSGRFGDVDVGDVIRCPSLSNNPDNCTIIIGVVHPNDKTVINVQIAIKEGILDTDKQTYIRDLLTKEEITWKEAIDEHLIIVLDINKDLLTPEFLECLRRSHLEEHIDLNNIEIFGVMDTKNGNVLSLQQGEESHIINLGLGVFHYTKINQWIPIKQAIQLGFVLFKPRDSDYEVGRVTVRWVKVGKDHAKVGLKEAISGNIIDPLNNTFNIFEEVVQITLIQAVMCGLVKIVDTDEEHKMDPEGFLVLWRSKTDPQIKELYQFERLKPMNLKVLSKLIKSEFSIEFFKVNERNENAVEAIYRDHLDVDPVVCGIENKTSIIGAILNRSLKVNQGVEFLKNIKGDFIGETIKGSLRVSQGREITEIMDRNKNLENKDLFVMNCKTFDIMSLDRMSLEDDQRLFFTSISVEDIEKKLKQLLKLKEIGMDIDTNTIRRQTRNPSSEFNTSMMEAVMNGVMLLDTLEFRDESKEKTFDLDASVKEYLIDERAARHLLNYASKMSFDQLINDGLFNMDANSFGEDVSLIKSIENGAVDPGLAYLMWPEKKALVNLSHLIDQDILDSEKNEVSIENAQNEKVIMTLSEALSPECGIFISKIDDKAIDNMLPRRLRDLIEDMNLNVEVDLVSFGETEIERRKIHDALKEGLLSDDSLVKLCDCDDEDAKTIEYCDNSDLLKHIEDVINMTERLKSLETQCSSIKDFLLNENKEDISKRLEDMESLFFDILEEEHSVEDKILKFINEIPIANINVNQRQLSHLSAKMKNMTDLASKISEDIERNQRKVSENELSSSLKLIKDGINQSGLKLNDLDKDIQELKNFKESSDSRNMSINDLNLKCHKLKEGEDEIDSISKNLSEINESFNKILDNKEGSKDDNVSEKVSNLENTLMSLNKLKDSVSLDIESVKPYFEDAMNNYNKLDKSLQEIEESVGSAQKQLSEEIQAKNIDKIIKLGENVTDIRNMLEEFESNVDDDFKATGLYEPLHERINDSRDNLECMKNDIKGLENEVTHRNDILNDIRQKSSILSKTLDNIEKNLNEIKLKDKNEATYECMAGIKLQFLETINPFEHLKCSCEDYINHRDNDNKDEIIDIRQTAIDNLRELYTQITEELTSQMEPLLDTEVAKMENLQKFLSDLPKTWNTNSEDVNANLAKMKNDLISLKESERKLQSMTGILNEDFGNQFGADTESLDNLSKTIQVCEKTRLKTFMDLENTINNVSNGYLPTLMSYENNKQITDASLSEISKNLGATSEEFSSFVENNENQSDDNFLITVKEKQNDLKKLSEKLADVEPVVEAVVAYGADIIEQLCSMNPDCLTEDNLLTNIKDDISSVTERYKDVKDILLEIDAKINNVLPENLKSSEDRIRDEVNSWNGLNDVLNRLDPIQSRPEKLQEQGKQISVIIDQILKKKNEFNKLRLSIDENNHHAVDDKSSDEQSNDDKNLSTSDMSDNSDQIKELETLIGSIEEKANHRLKVINNVSNISKNFWPEIMFLNNVISEMKKFGSEIEVFPKVTELNMPVVSEDALGKDNVGENSKFQINTGLINSNIVLQQIKLLTGMDSTVEDCILKLRSELDLKAKSIIEAGGDSCEFEVKEYLESVWDNVEDAQDILGEKHIELDEGFYLMNLLSEEIKNISEWFPSIENRLNSIKNGVADKKVIELNISQLKTLNAEVFSRLGAIETISSTINEICSYPNVTNKASLEEMKKGIDDRYSAVMKKIMDKHKELQEKYTEIGEIDFLVDDSIGIMQELENQIKTLSMETCSGDEAFTSSCLRNLQILSSEFDKQRLGIINIKDVISKLKGSAEGGDFKTGGNLTLFGKFEEIEDISRNIKELIPMKEKMLKDILQNEKVLSKDIHKYTDDLEALKVSLKHSPKIGFTHDSLNQFSQNHLTLVKELAEKQELISSAIEKANALISSCPKERCSLLATAVKKLNHKLKRCQDLAFKQKEKLNRFSDLIISFDEDKVSLSKETLDLENISLMKSHPSKLTEKCAEQIGEVKVYISKAEKCMDVLEHLNIRSFEIRRLGNRFENSQLHLEFKEYGLKLSKIQRCIKERLRIFTQAYKEDKLFSDSYEHLNNWLDESYTLIDGFKSEPTKVQEHMDQLKLLSQQLSAQYANFHYTVRQGSYLKDRCLATDPEKDILSEMLKTLKNKWNKVRTLIITEKAGLGRKVIETGNIYDAIKCFRYWINDIISKFDPKMKLNGDVDTVEVLIMDCRASIEEADHHSNDFETLKKRLLKEIKDYEENDIRKEISEIEVRYNDYTANLKKREEALKDSLELAREFKEKVEEVRIWADQTEKQIKLKSLPKCQTESDVIEIIKKHENLLKSLNDIKVVVNDMKNLSRSILDKCNPSAKKYVSRVVLLLTSRYNQICQRSEARSKKLNEALKNFRGSSALIEELIQKVTEYHNKIKECGSNLPRDLESAATLNNSHTIFHNEVLAMDKQIKALIKEYKNRNANGSSLPEKGKGKSQLFKISGKAPKELLHRASQEMTTNHRLNFLSTHFNHLFKLSVERKSLLQERLTSLTEEESMKKFDFNTWRDEFLVFVKNKGLRLTDLFRRQSTKVTGYLTEEEFIECIKKSRFPTTTSVLKEVFHIFDSSNDKLISYQEFINAMKSDRKPLETNIKNVNMDDKREVTKIIHDIIEREVVKCTCHQMFHAKKEGDNKYSFGSNNKTYMVRYLNSSVMVRIGGGWQNLTEFLAIHDPCRERTSSLASTSDYNKSKSTKSDSRTSSISLSSKNVSKPSTESPRPSIVSTRTNSELQEKPGKKDQSLKPGKSQPSMTARPPRKK